MNLMNNEISEKMGMQIKNAATFNHSAHNMLNAVINKEQNNEGILMMMIPDIILCAFTCELYIKSILFKEKIKFKRVHNLDDLFYLLDKETQEFIGEETIKGLKHYAPELEYNFKEKLKNNGDAFAQARYFYENGLSVDYLFLNVFVKVLEHTSKEIYTQ